MIACWDADDAQIMVTSPLAQNGKIMAVFETKRKDKAAYSYTRYMCDETK